PRRSSDLIANLAVVIHGNFAQIDVETEEEPAFTWNEQYAAADTRFYSAFLSHVREICVGKNIHHAPCVVCLIATEFITQGFSHVTAGTVCSDDVLGANLHFRTGVWPDRTTQRHGQRVLRLGII